MARERKFIGLKDLVLVLLLGLLSLVIGMVVTPLLTVLGMFWGSIIGGAIPAFLSGFIYVLIQTKAPRTGATFLYAVPFMILYVISGSLSTALFFFAEGVIGELTMIGGYGKKWRPLVPYILHWLTYFFAATIQYIFMRGVLVETYMGMGMDEATAGAAVDAFGSVYAAPLNMLVFLAFALVASTLGYVLGTRVLRKHFAPAGVA